MTSRKLSVSSVSNLAAQGVTILCTFIVSPILIGKLGQSEYGLWILAFSITSYLQILDLGMRGTAIRFLSSAITDKDTSRFGALFATFKNFYSKLGLIILALGIAVGIAPLAHSFEPTTEKLLVLVSIFSVITGISFIFSIYSALLRSSINYHVLTSVASGRQILFAGSVFLLRDSLTLIELTIIYSSLVIAEQLLLRFYGGKHTPAETTPPLTSKELKPVISHSRHNILLNFTEKLRWRSDMQIVAHSMDLEAVTQYGIGIRIPTLFYQFIVALFGSQFVAAFGQMANTNSQKDIRQYLDSSYRVCVAASYTVATCLFFVAPPFIERWLGPGFDSAKSIMTFILFPAAAFWGMSPLFCYLTAEGKHAGIAKASLAASVFHLILSIILVEPFGLNGIAISLFVEFTILTIALSVITGRATNIKVVKILEIGAFRPLIIIGLLAWPFSILTHFIDPDNYFVIFLNALAIFAVTSLVTWVFVLDRPTRELMLSILRRATGK